MTDDPLAHPGTRRDEPVEHPDAMHPDATPDGGSAPSRVREAGLYLIAFASGFAVMTIEIAGARVMAPTFGLSAVPWTAVIGVILASLAAGNHLGGRMADHGRIPLAAILAVAGGTAVIPVLGGFIPGWAAASLGFIPGAVVSALLLFAAPVLCLGAVVPYLIRAGTISMETVGRRAGDVSAAATVGSILGTFSTGFLLLPLVPLPVLLAGTGAGLLALAALTAVLLGRGPGTETLLIGGVVVALVGVGGWAEGPGVLHREETVYSSIQVVESEWASGRVRELVQSGGSSSAEYVESGLPAHDYVEASGRLLEPVLGRVDSVLVLGGAALSLPVALVARTPGLTVDVVELDPAVTRLAREYFAYGAVADRANIRVIHRDARRHLATDDASYDVVYLDVFDHLVTVPWTLVTVEALRLMRHRLTPDGLFMANVLSPTGGPAVDFLQRLLATLEEVFPAVRAYPVDPELDPGVTQNILVVAAGSEEALPEVGWPTVPVGPEGPPLTDAHAPVEYLQAKVFLQGLRWR